MFRIRRALWQSVGMHPEDMPLGELLDTLAILSAEESFQRFLAAREKAASRHIGA